MPTDWNLIREMMAAAIDSCEQIEAAGYSEQDRDLTIDVSGQKISVHEFMVSAWTLPENLRYRIIRDRHDKSIDLPYIPEAARVVNWCGNDQAGGSGSSIGHPMVSRTCGPPCAASHCDGTLSDVRV
jgi:hypothetical protein